LRCTRSLESFDVFEYKKHAKEADFGNPLLQLRTGAGGSPVHWVVAFTYSDDVSSVIIARPGAHRTTMTPEADRRSSARARGVDDELKLAAVRVVSS